MVELWRQESEQIHRNKARRIRRKSWRKRGALVCGVTCTAYSVMFLGWLWQSGQIDKMQKQTDRWFEGQLRQTGMVVKSVSVSGLDKLSAEAVVEQAAIRQGVPLFNISLADLKAKLESHSQIAEANIERIYPDQLAIHITERKPAALWQHEGEWQWVDAEGVLLHSHWTQEEQPAHLPIITGEDAYKQMPKLMKILFQAPELKEKVVAGQWIGDRRWNLKLDKEMRVLLPMEKPEEAWRKLAELNEKYELLDLAVEQIDLRIEGRAFVTYQEGAEPKSGELVTAFAIMKE